MNRVRHTRGGLGGVAWLGALLGLLWLGAAPNALAVETVTYYHFDALGSPVAASDAQGVLLWREAYAPYGARLRHEHGGAERLGYTAKPEEAAFGLNYFGARWYDPALGRFLGLDPVAFQADNPHSFNRYAYANNNPYKYIDPDGRTGVAVAPPPPPPGGQSAGIGGYNWSAPWLPESWRNQLNLTGVIAQCILTNCLGTALFNEEANSNASAPDKGEIDSTENTNPYKGPVDKPVIVVDQHGNAIPVGKGQQINTSPNGDYQQVIGADGKPTGDRLDRGGHKGQKDPRARDPHAHRPGVTTPDGNPHLPIYQ